MKKRRSISFKDYRLFIKEVKVLISYFLVNYVIYSAFFIRIRRLISKLFLFRVSSSTIVLRMDGGICSQMHFYLIGEIFMKKGYNVKFDLTWFKKNGKDIDGKYARNFELTTIFPTLRFKEAMPKDIFYTKSYPYFNDYFCKDSTHDYDYLNVSAPCYLYGYFKDPEFLYTTLFHETFKVDYSILNNENSKILDDINSKIVSVAIHVRRGDLARYNVAYGNPCSVEYFDKAINYIQKKYKNAFFYFFSDEPEWVKTELIKQIRVENKNYIVDINGSDKGYMDLILISLCHHHITSKGSFGKYGALLANKKKGIIICNDDETEYQWKVLNNVIFI